MNYPFLRFLLVGLVAVLLEGYFFTALAGVYGPVFRLSLIVVFYLAVWRVNYVSLTLAGLFGLVLDVVYAYPLGLNITIFISLLFWQNLIMDKGINLKQNRLLAALFVGFSVIYYHVVVDLYDFLFERLSITGDLVVKNALEALITALVVLVLHRLILKLFVKNKKGTRG